MLIKSAQPSGIFERSVAPTKDKSATTAPTDLWLDAWKAIFPCLPQPKQNSPKTGSFSSSDTRFYPTSPPSLSHQRLPKSLGMPYTPPSHRSPASSAPSSPEVSRRSSFNGPSQTRPSLPRSASYLTKHRRTPSVPTSGPPADGSISNGTLPGTSDDLKDMAANHNGIPVRQSPPPVTDGRTMPAGAILSPPESQSSSEDEGTTGKSRGRQIENLKELQDAISAIPQHRESSPARSSPGDLLVSTSQINDLVGAVQNGFGTEGMTQAPKGHRKISHSRSNTDPNISISKSVGASPTASEECSEEDDSPRKPPMVRKKSGELVRPALRPASHRRPSSMPGTPTFSKAVHFDSHLEHVRHFLQVDRPLAVSAGSSPAENYESDAEYPFNKVDEKPRSRTPPYEWEIVINNFPSETPLRKALPVRLERVWMSNDHKSLIGCIAVANLAFHKTVVCRFTFDYWKTTSEVTAEYCHEIRPRDTVTGSDRFQFTIKLSDLANLETKTLYMCIRYNVNGLEYWDNNNGMNFQVDFRKKMLPQNGKQNFQGASSRPLNSLPRSNRRSNPSSAARPKSMPIGGMDDFGHGVKFNFDQPIHEYLGETRSTGLRLKMSKSTTALPSDNLAGKLSAPSGLAFSNRYDFGASLNAAKQAHRESSSPRGSPKPDGLYMKPNKKASFGPPIQTGSREANGSASDPSVSATVSKPPGTDSPASASIASSTYEEILNKYCFFNGSKQTSPQLKDGTLRIGRYDGAGDELSYGLNSSTDSSTHSSPDMAEKKSGALHKAIHHNLNPYFQNMHLAVGGSPIESPLSGPASSSAPKSSSPTPMGAGFTPLTGTSTIGSEPAFLFAQHASDRFPFTAEAHISTAIRG